MVHAAVINVALVTLFAGESLVTKMAIILHFHWTMDSEKNKTSFTLLEKLYGKYFEVKFWSMDRQKVMHMSPPS